MGKVEIYYNQLNVKPIMVGSRAVSKQRNRVIFAGFFFFCKLLSNRQDRRNASVSKDGEKHLVAFLFSTIKMAFLNVACAVFYKEIR